MAPPPASRAADSNPADPSRPAAGAPEPITVPSPRDHLHHHLIDRRDTPRGRAWEPERSRRGGAMDGAAAVKLVSGEAGYVLEDVPHVSDYLPDLPVSAAVPGAEWGRGSIWWGWRGRAGSR